jgi:hypothetical protein
VDRLEVRGARMMLEGGLVHAHIRPRPEATWSIDAGPYVVHVTGTEFDLAWDVDAQTLDLRLLKGRVTVEGPLANGNIYMEAGQHLIANARDGSLSINERSARTSTALPSGLSSWVSGDEPPHAAAESTGSSSPRPGGSVPSSHATVSARTSPAVGPAVAAASPSWAARVAQGNFQEVVDDAERRGIDRTLAEGSLADLAALADAARYARRQDVARRALIAERTRYAGSVRADDAAFFLADLSESSGDEAASLDWNETYLRESPNGAYASQALGRKIMIVQRLRGPDEARVLATEYLRRFPEGPYASYAKKLLQNR